jgi:hypothetical protein
MARVPSGTQWKASSIENVGWNSDKPYSWVRKCFPCVIKQRILFAKVVTVEGVLRSFEELD